MLSEQHAQNAGIVARLDRRYREAESAVSPLKRLSALHREAEETALLANILGRTPWLAVLLFAGAAAALALGAGFTLNPAPIAWALCMLAGVFALLRLHRHAARSPFELLALRAFKADLKAILLYAGFAWGAGAFLALPTSNLLIVIALFAGMGAAIELVLRLPSAALYFLVPSIALAAAAMALGPLGFASACLVVAAGGCVAAGADIAAKIVARPSRPALTIS